MFSYLCLFLYSRTTIRCALSTACRGWNTRGATAFSITEEKKIAGKKQVEVTVALPVDREIPSGDYYEVQEFPETTAAVMAHYGAGSTSSAWNQLCRFISANGYQHMATYREYYIVSAPNPEGFWVTELQLPVKKNR